MDWDLSQKQSCGGIRLALIDGGLVRLRPDRSLMKTRVNLPEQQASSRKESSSWANDLISPAATRVGFWARLTARLRSWFEVPLGYEDDTGFHYGAQSTPTARQATETTPVRAQTLTDRADQAIKHSTVLPVTDQPAPSATPATSEQKPETVPH
jgi:hypothetical protein